MEVDSGEPTLRLVGKIVMAKSARHGSPVRAEPLSNECSITPGRVRQISDPGVYSHRAATLAYMAAHGHARFGPLMLRWTASWSFIIPFVTHLLLAQSPSAPISSDTAHTKPAERLALLRPVCGTYANENGCSTCPPGTDYPTNYPNGRFDVTGVVYGHFLSSRSDDAAIGFSGCESHASGSGGTFLLSRQNGAWKLVSMRPAAIVEDCKKLGARDGHDVLICFGHDSHQGTASNFLYLLDFESPWNPQEGLDIFLLVLDSADGCALMAETLVSGIIDRVSFAETGRIAVEARLGSITAIEFNAIADDCHAGDPTPNPLGLRLATVRKTYTFSFNGKSVIPTPGNPPMDGNLAIPPETRALLPSAYMAPDGSFTIPVPYTFRTIRNPRGSSSPVCDVSALVCFLYPGGAKTQAAVEISKIEATTEISCLNPEHLPGRASHFVPGSYGYSSALGGGPAKYGFWSGITAQYQLDQSVNRVWHGGACYQVAANIAHARNTETNDDQIGQTLMRVVNEFRFRKPH